MSQILDGAGVPTRALILARKVSPRAFVERKGEAAGEIGIEGTAIEAPVQVRRPASKIRV